MMDTQDQKSWPYTGRTEQRKETHRAHEPPERVKMSNEIVTVSPGMAAKSLYRKQEIWSNLYSKVKKHVFIVCVTRQNSTSHLGSGFSSGVSRLWKSAWLLKRLGAPCTSYTQGPWGGAGPHPENHCVAQQPGIWLLQLQLEGNLS